MGMTPVSLTSNTVNIVMNESADCYRLLAMHLNLGHGHKQTPNKGVFPTIIICSIG